MIITCEYDVFIAFHDSSGEDGALSQAYAIYNYLSNKGIKCFFYPESSTNSVYKANFMKIMQSRLLIMVCNDNLSRNEYGEININDNYHLYVELDSFYAMTQEDDIEKTINDAAVLYFSNNGTGRMCQSPERIHPLFNNRNSFFIAQSIEDEECFEDVIGWVENSLDKFENENISDEPVAMMVGRVSDVFNQKIEGIDFRRILRKATAIKCIGISNWTFTLTDGCKKLINGLKHGTRFEMIFLDPDGKNAEIRSNEEAKDTSGQISQSFDMMKAQLEENFGPNDEVLQKLNLFTYDMIPRENLIFIYSTCGDYVFVQHYSHALPGSVSPCTIIANKNRSGSSLFNYYEKIFESIKNNKRTKAYTL